MFVCACTAVTSYTTNPLSSLKVTLEIYIQKVLSCNSGGIFCDPASP